MFRRVEIFTFLKFSDIQPMEALIVTWISGRENMEEEGLVFFEPQ